MEMFMHSSRHSPGLFYHQARIRRNPPLRKLHGQAVLYLKLVGPHSCSTRLPQTWIYFEPTPCFPI